MGTYFARPLTTADYTACTHVSDAAESDVPCVLGYQDDPGKLRGAVLTDERLLMGDAKTVARILDVFGGAPTISMVTWIRLTRGCADLALESKLVVYKLYKEQTEMRDGITHASVVLSNAIYVTAGTRTALPENAHLVQELTIMHVFR